MFNKKYKKQMQELDERISIARAAFERYMDLAMAAKDDDLRISLVDVAQEWLKTSFKLMELRYDSKKR